MISTPLQSAESAKFVDKFAYADAMPIAQKFIAFLEKHCTRCVIAGSLRRRKQMVSDIEILFVSKTTHVTDPTDLFGAKIEVSAAGAAINALLLSRLIAKRPNKNGGFTWGAQNKLAVHIESGIPVDFFETSEDCFFNALFVRTGPASLNKSVASRAIESGWSWHAYGNGFTRGSRERKAVKSERDVFDHVQLPYQEPWER